MEQKSVKAYINNGAKTATKAAINGGSVAGKMSKSDFEKKSASHFEEALIMARRGGEIIRDVNEIRAAKTEVVKTFPFPEPQVRAQPAPIPAPQVVTPAPVIQKTETIEINAEIITPQQNQNQSYRQQANNCGCNQRRPNRPSPGPPPPPQNCNPMPQPPPTPCYDEPGKSCNQYTPKKN